MNPIEENFMRKLSPAHVATAVVMAFAATAASAQAVTSGGVARGAVATGSAPTTTTNPTTVSGSSNTGSGMANSAAETAAASTTPTPASNNGLNVNSLGTTNTGTATTGTSTGGTTGTTGTASSLPLGIVPGNLGFTGLAPTDANGNPIVGNPSGNVVVQVAPNSAATGGTTITATPLLDEVTRAATARELARRNQKKEPRIIGIAPRTDADKTNQMPDDPVIRY
jgi:hypothetical protein